MTITWLGAVVILLLAVMTFQGYRRGFLRELITSVCMIITLAAASFLSPYVSTFLYDHTPAYDAIHKSLDGIINRQDNASDATEEMVSADGPGDWNNAQITYIEGLDIPSLLKNAILSGNSETETGSQASPASTAQGQATLSEYLADYLTEAIMKGLSYLIAYILVSLLFQIAFAALDIFTRLPIIRGVNRLTGGLLGLFKGLVLLWVVFLFLTVLCGTYIGKGALDLIEKDYILSFIYNNDILIKLYMA